MPAPAIETEAEIAIVEAARIEIARVEAARVEAAAAILCDLLHEPTSEIAGSYAWAKAQLKILSPEDKDILKGCMDKTEKKGTWVSEKETHQALFLAVWKVLERNEGGHCKPPLAERTVKSLLAARTSSASAMKALFPDILDSKMKPKALKGSEGRQSIILKIVEKYPELEVILSSFSGKIALTEQGATEGKEAVREGAASSIEAARKRQKDKRISQKADVEAAAINIMRFKRPSPPSQLLDGAHNTTHGNGSGRKRPASPTNHNDKGQAKRSMIGAGRWS